MEFHVWGPVPPMYGLLIASVLHVAYTSDPHFVSSVISDISSDSDLLLTPSTAPPDALATDKTRSSCLQLRARRSPDRRR